jgi:ABC-2 type transport system ATP-binding protein
MNIIEINKVTKRYAKHVALDEITLSIPAKSVFGLLGPNGAGKTSLIRIITRITAPDQGEIYFNGQPLDNVHSAKMGYLPEERGLYKKMEVGEQALYLARLKGLSRAEAMKRLKYWFEKFGIQEWWNKKVEELSKGMAQKVQFITTILHEPEFIILDEPFTGFDPINADLIKNELLELKQKGVTIVLSTHRMESVEELCSHIALINQSKVILNGSVKSIRQQFRTNAYSLSYSGDPVELSKAMNGMGVILENAVHDDHYAVTLKLNDSVTTNDMLQKLLPIARVNSLNEVIPGMSEIFIRQVNAASAGVVNHN